MRAPNHLNALRAFEAAGRHLSYVAAADELNVTPAAVGQLVRKLEGALGVELFRRSVAGLARLELTDSARIILPELQAGFDLLSVAVKRLSHEGQRTVVTVTVPPAFADKWLLPRVERFQSRHPGYDLRIDTNGRLVDFTVDAVDVGIRYGAGRWPGLKATFLLEDEFFPVCSPALLSASHPLDNLCALRHYPLIHDMSMASERAFPTWRAWLEHAAQTHAGHADIPSDGGMRINDSAAVIQAAIAGNGVALGRTTLVAADIAAGRLVRPFDDALSCDLAYYIVHKAQKNHAPFILAFTEWLLDEAQEQ